MLSRRHPAFTTTEASGDPTLRITVQEKLLCSSCISLRLLTQPTRLTRSRTTIIAARSEARIANPSLQKVVSNVRVSILGVRP